MSTEGPEIWARMRFDDPARFLEFYEKQLGPGLVGLRHADSVQVGARIHLAVTPPGLVDPLDCEGLAERVTPTAEGGARLHVRITLEGSTRARLDAYLGGIEAGRRVAAASTPAAPPAPGDPLAGEATPSLEEARARCTRMETQTYFAILDVPMDVGAEALQRRFHALTRQFHPDAFFDADPDLRTAVGRFFRRVNEAYAVLKDPRRRRLYERGLSGPPHTWALRLTEEAALAAQRQRRVRGGETQTGQWHWTHAREILQRARDEETPTRPALVEAAKMLRVALALEPSNEHFQHALEQLEYRISTEPA
jgi:hypothetical protein